MSLTARLRCPTCGAEVAAAVTPELLRQAAERGAVRALARCPRGHAVVLTLDQYGYIRSALPTQDVGHHGCEVTDRAPLFIRPRLQAILSKGAVADADQLLLEKAKASGWVVCV